MYWEKALSDLGIDDELIKLSGDALKATGEVREEVRRRASVNQWKVLRALQDAGLSEGHFFGSTGYGFGDTGREALDEALARIFKCEAGCLRWQIVSGTHALAAGIFSCLKPGEEMLSLTGDTYDTLWPVIGHHTVPGQEPPCGSLAHWGVTFRSNALDEAGHLDFAGIAPAMNEHTSLVYMQKSRGYSSRPTLSFEDISRAVKLVRARASELGRSVTIMVDNCYGELVELHEPTEAGIDLVAGSLIKNLGGGIAPCGGYLAGRRQCVERAAERLTAPGIGPEEGATLGNNRLLAQGLFNAPVAVGAALEGAVWGSWLMEKAGLVTNPRWDDERRDIIQEVQVGSRDGLVAFCRGIQKAGPVDHSALPVPTEMPGYADEVIMAAGTFIQGSSLELTADGPLRPPFSCFMQGGVSFPHVQIGILLAMQELKARHII